MGHFRVSQFPLYLKNEEDLSRQIHSHFAFRCLENVLKDRLSKTSSWQFHKWLYGPETFSGLSRNGPLVNLLGSFVPVKGPVFKTRDDNRKRTFRALGQWCLPDFYTNHL